MKDISLLYTTCPSEKSAISLGKKALNKGLCGCVNIWRINSLYTFENIFHQEEEWGVLLKLPKEKLAPLTTYLKKIHPFETPALLALPAKAEQDFFSWLNSTPPPPKS